MGVKFQSDRETFLLLKTQDNQGFAILYKYYYPCVKNFILKNNGSEDDAKDIFQETIVVLLEKIPNDNFNLTSSLKTYVFAISSNLWLNCLRKSNKIVKSDIDQYEIYLADYEATEEEIHQNNSNKIVNVFKSMTNKCMVLLKAIFFEEKNIDTITNEFGYTNKHNAQNQKFKCLEQARRGAELLK